MAKDPAVLFYTNDFLTGTFTMSDEQVGKYIKLLCLQHQKGLLSEKDMLSICKSYDEDIFAKFIKTDAGFYNQRMKDEADKRKQYSESRRKNKMKKKDDEHMINISESYVSHMENENEDEIININKDKNISKNAKSKKEETELVFISDEWKGLWAEWKEYRLIEKKKWFKSNKYEQMAINKLVKESDENLETAQKMVVQSMQKNWVDIYKLKIENNVTTQSGNQSGTFDKYRDRLEQSRKFAEELDKQRGFRP
jgi:hypothetical protein